MVQVELGLCKSRRPSEWIYGQVGGVEVWQVDGDESVLVSVMVCDGRAIVLLNRGVAGTSREHACLDWALNIIASDQPKLFSALLASGVTSGG